MAHDRLAHRVGDVVQQRVAAGDEHAAVELEPRREHVRGVAAGVAGPEDLCRARDVGDEAVGISRVGAVLIFVRERDREPLHDALAHGEAGECALVVVARVRLEEERAVSGARAQHAPRPERQIAKRRGGDGGVVPVGAVQGEILERDLDAWHEEVIEPVLVRGVHLVGERVLVGFVEEELPAGEVFARKEVLALGGDVAQPGEGGEPEVPVGGDREGRLVSRGVPECVRVELRPRRQLEAPVGACPGLRRGADNRRRTDERRYGPHEPHAPPPGFEDRISLAY